MYNQSATEYDDKSAGLAFVLAFQIAAIHHS